MKQPFKLKFKSLLAEVERWKAIKEIRAYISEFEKFNEEKGKLTPEVEERITWMKQKVDWYDPHVNLVDEMLGNLNKDTLQSNRAQSSYW